MALLTPNATYNVNGVTVHEKIIPDGTRWKDANKAVKAGFRAGSLYKKEQRLTNNTGKAAFVTIHNTNDLDNVNDDAEQYTRATYNENMKSVRVHFYVDDLGAWQEMKAGTGLCTNDPVGSAEVTWHSGDGSTVDGGNMTSISMEIIMNDNAEHDAKAYDNGARIAAWMLWKHGLTIDKLVTHTYWVNKSAGKSFADVDEQCCNPIKNEKWCPTYIFKSSVKATAMKNWKAFKAVVQGYLNSLNGSTTTEPPKQNTNTESATAIKENDVVKIASNATYYDGKKPVPNWVKNRTWIVRQVKGDRVVIDKSEDGKNAICSPISTKYLTVVKTAQTATAAPFSPYLVKVTTDALNIRKGAGTNFAKVGCITDRGVYTIVAESAGKGSDKGWGKLKSGAGWISLDYCTKR